MDPLYIFMPVFACGIISAFLGYRLGLKQGFKEGFDDGFYSEYRPEVSNED